MSMAAAWRPVSTDELLQRSSQTVDVVDGQVYVFGGELRPRQPRDNKIFKLDMKSVDDGNDDLKAELVNTDGTPSPRVGAASTALHGKIYMFSGRGGEAMAPLEEKGALWVFDTATLAWSVLLPTSEEYPEGRSYHCATNDGSQHIYIHAGCPASGRLADMWKFHIPSRVWIRCADAPGPPRGGPSITFHAGYVFRMNGFDGKTEQGGSIDIFNSKIESWSSKRFVADGVDGPAPRSVGSLVCVTRHGRPSLVTLFGEGDPSALGHAGAGKMFADAWSYDLEEETWQKLDFPPSPQPEARGWFDASAIGASSILISGGLGEDNNRIADAWILSF